jgi:zinc transporter 1/2/3
MVEAAWDSMLLHKLLVISGAFLVTILSGLLPWLLKARLRGQWTGLVSLLSCLAGGIFMSAVMLDLIPDTREAFEGIVEQLDRLHGWHLAGRPVAEGVILGGFFFILGFEQCVLQWKESKEKAEQEEERPLLAGAGVRSYRAAEQGGQEPSVVGLSSEVHHAGDGHDAKRHNHASHGSFGHSVERTLFLLAALSVHSVFEGLAIGLQTDIQDTLVLCGAVMAHKLVMSFSLGLSLCNLRLRWFLLANAIFSLASPLGIASGMVLLAQHDGKSSLTMDCVEGALQGVAAGTFIYITFFEVLPHELNTPSWRIPKVLATLAGTLIFAAIFFTSSHNHH